jgi:nudix-type nucleoside diphosphatase (YffH/AdpP family)
VAENVIIRKRKSTPFGPFRVDEVDLQVQRQDGTYQDLKRVSFERGDSVAVLVHRRDTNAVVLARQFRYSALANREERSDGFIVELPAGIVDDGETPYQAAEREVAEELGYSVTNLQHVATFFVSPGGTSERILLFYAMVDGPPQGAGGGLSSEAEDIQVLTLPVDEFIEKIQRNEIRDGKTLLAGYWFLATRRGVA